MYCLFIMFTLNHIIKYCKSYNYFWDFNRQVENIQM